MSYPVEGTPLTITRIHGSFPRDRIEQTVNVFGEMVQKIGPVLIASHELFSHRDILASSVASQQSRGRAVEVVYSKNHHRPGTINHSAMFNLGIKECAQQGLPYFATVSSDLGEYLPAVLPARDRLHQNPQLLMVGVEVEGIHDTELIRRVKQADTSIIHSGNYARAFLNNAFAVHRLKPVIDGEVLSIEERQFNQLHEDTLGRVVIGDKQIPLWGHEDLELPLRLLANGKPAEVLLLAGQQYSVVRDPSKEVPAHPYKKATRQPVASAYQKYYGITDDSLNSYLSQHFQIEAA
jgi:hypothetical protein